MSSKPFKNFYAVLGVQPSATQQEIKTVYKKEVLKSHPDKNKDVDVARFRDVQEAYETLKKPESRKVFDEKLKIEELKKKAEQLKTDYRSNEFNRYASNPEPSSRNFSSRYSSSQVNGNKNQGISKVDPTLFEPYIDARTKDMFESLKKAKERVIYFDKG